MGDLILYETGNGGDIQKVGNDIVVANDIFSLIYLAWFGGNVEASTTGNEQVGEQRQDWWGNSLLLGNNSDSQFNSQLERALQQNELTSRGRQRIEQAAINDLKPLAFLGDFQVSVTIIDVNKIQITAEVTEPGSGQNLEYKFIWDATRAAVIIDRPAGTAATPTYIYNGLINDDFKEGYSGTVPGQSITGWNQIASNGDEVFHENGGAIHRMELVTGGGASSCTYRNTAFIPGGKIYDAIVRAREPNNVDTATVELDIFNGIFLLNVGDAITVTNGNILTNYPAVVDLSAFPAGGYLQFKANIFTTENLQIDRITLTAQS